MLARFIPGIPAPQGSKRHVGNGRMIESSKKVGPWRNAVAAAFADVAEHKKPLFPNEALTVLAVYYLPRLPTVKRVWPTVPPDIDKLDRGLLDALTLAGVWEDDAQVVELWSIKQYADFEQAGCLINIDVKDLVPIFPGA